MCLAVDLEEVGKRGQSKNTWSGQPEESIKIR